MPRLPFSQVPDQPASVGRLESPSIAAPQDGRAQQLQETGRAMTAAGVQAMDVAEAQHQDYLALVARENDSLFSDAVRQADNGYVSLRGKAAQEGRQAANEALVETRKKLAAGIKDEDARVVFEDRAARRTQSVMARWDDHERDQVLNWDLGQATADGKAAVEDYLRFADDPRASAAARQRAIASANRTADLTGAPPALRARLVQENTTAMHAGLAEHLIRNQQFAQAQQVLADAGDEIDIGRRDELAQQLRVGTTHEQAYQVATAPDVVNLPLPEKLAAFAAQRQAGKITTEVMDLAARRAFTDRQQARAAREASDADLLKNATDWISANQGADLKGLGAPQIQQLQAAGLWDEVEAFAVDGATTRPTGLARLNELLDDPSPLKGASWGATFSSLRPVLDNRRMAVVRELWEQQNGQGGRGHAGASVPPQTELVSDERFKIGLAKELNVLPTGVEDTKGIAGSLPAYNAFLERLETDVNAEERRLGRKLSRDEQRTIVKGYKQLEAELGGRRVLLPLEKPEDAVRAAVVAKGQRVAIGEVLRAPDDPEGAGIRPEYAALVQQWNAEQRGKQPPLDPNNPTHVARVLAETRAVEAERAAVREPVRAERAADLRWQQLQQKQREDAVIRELFNRNVPLNDPEWLRVTDPAKWEEQRPMIERRKRELANPWRK